MIKNIKIASILSFIFLAGISSTCYEEWPCESEYCIYYVGISTMDLTDMDNSEKEIKSAGDTVTNESYAMSVKFEMEDVLLGYNEGNSSFFSGAYASSNVENTMTYQLHDTIENIKIITIFDFDSDHSAGSDISNYFLGETQGIFDPVGESSSTVPIKYELLETLPEVIDEVNNLSSIYGMHFWINLYLVNPSLNKQSRFVLQVDLLDGRLLQDTTNLIIWR